MSPASIFRFDDYEVDIRASQIFKRGVKISLREKSFQILKILLESAGEVVTREELQRRLWPADVFVDVDNNLNTAIASLRQALRDSAEHPRFIETVARRGYRFLRRVTKCIPSARPGPALRAKIVVLPFINLSGDPSQERFSDAVTDEIITALAELAPEHLAVIARTTAMYYKGKQKDVAHFRRELGVDYLVEGALRQTQDRVLINTQLIKTSDQTHLFAKKYEATLNEIFNLPNRIAQAMAEHIPETAGGIRSSQLAGAGAGKLPTTDLVAYNYYLLGRQQIQRCNSEPRSMMARAKKYFEDAIERDSHFALAYAALAEWYWWRAALGLGRPREAFSAEMAAAQRAIEVDPSLGVAHAFAGISYSHLEFDWAAAHREMKLALQLDPASPDVRFHYAADYLLPRGQIREAIAELERILDSDPLSVYVRFWLGYALYMAQDYSRAEEQFRFLRELAPDRQKELRCALDIGYFGLGLVRRAEARFGDAVDAFRRAVELSDGELPMRWASLGAALAGQGDVGEARAILKRLEAMATESYCPATCIAWICLALGDQDAGFTWMERAVDERDPAVLSIHAYATLAPLRTHPRFTDLLRKMNVGAHASNRAAPAP